MSGNYENPDEPLEILRPDEVEVHIFKSPESIELNLQSIEQCLQQNNLHKALELTKKGLQFYPHHLSFQMNFVKLAFLLNRHTEVTDYLKQLVLLPEIIEIWQYYLQELLNSKNYLLGKNAFETLIARAFILKKLDLLKPVDDLLKNAVGNNCLFFQTYQILGEAYLKQKLYTKALNCFHFLFERERTFALLKNLGRTLMGCGKVNEFIILYEKNWNEFSHHIEFYHELGMAYYYNQQIVKAISIYEKVLSFNQNYQPALKNLGLFYQEIGELKRAEVCYKKLLSFNPSDEGIQRCQFFALSYDFDSKIQTIFSKVKNWAMGLQPHREVDKKHLKKNKRVLNIGYVSPDFRQHAAAYLIDALLTYTNRSKFKLFCYANVSQSDSLTEKFREKSENWRYIRHLSDNQVSELIIADEIDILVDLAGHTAHHSLGVFAKKSVPIQVSLYPMTTGLVTMDYRFADPYLTSQRTLACNTEQLLHLKHCFFCFNPEEMNIPVSAVPSSNRNYITFGSFNNLSKLNDKVIELWSKILTALPDSQLILKSKVLRDIELHPFVLKKFERWGVDSQRIELFASLSRNEHFNLYNQVDIALDPFPYNGMTTTCEALWMGVPVIALKGPEDCLDFSRASYSILKHIGQESLVVENTNDYVIKAVELAQNFSLRSELKTSLRSSVIESLLGDLEGYVEEIETYYRIIWENGLKNP